MTFLINSLRRLSLWLTDCSVWKGKQWNRPIPNVLQSSGFHPQSTAQTPPRPPAFLQPVLQLPALWLASAWQPAVCPACLPACSLPLSASWLPVLRWLTGDSLRQAVCSQTTCCFLTAWKLWLPVLSEGSLLCSKSLIPLAACPFGLVPGTACCPEQCVPAAPDSALCGLCGRPLSSDYSLISHLSLSLTLSHSCSSALFHMSHCTNPAH